MIDSLNYDLNLYSFYLQNIKTLSNTFSIQVFEQ